MRLEKEFSEEKFKISRIKRKVLLLILPEKFNIKWSLHTDDKKT